MMFKAMTIAMMLICVSGASAKPAKEQQVFIENDRIRVGVDLSIGGAVTYASKVGGMNIINSCDWGRQIQQSYYSGPPNYTREGKEKSPVWAGFCWNPIQSGDSYGNGSKVLEYKRTDSSLYVKTIPMLWPMRDDPGECFFETWITLRGNTFTWRARLTNERSDKTSYGAYPQESPAVYTNGPWDKLMAYTGDKPFSGGDLTEVRNDHHEPWPWVEFLATEGWAALINAQGEGIGVRNPTASLFHGGFAGKRGSGGPKDSPTGYMSPVRTEILDHNIVYEYECVLIVGTLQEIRDDARKHKPSALPRWSFKRDRAGWSYENAKDAGWPVRGGIELQSTGAAPARMVGPIGFWYAEKAPYAAIRATVSKGAGGEAKVYWRGTAPKPFLTGNEWGEWSQRWWVPERSATVSLIGDGKERWYLVDLSAHKAYVGGVTGLALDLPAMTPDARITVHEIRLLRSADAGKRLE